MDELYEVVKLSSTQSLLTDKNGDTFDAILVYSGLVRVFVAWVKGEDRYGRRVLLSEIPAGHSIPGFSAETQDENDETIRWCFVLEAPNGAELRLMRGMGTSVTNKKFVKTVESLSPSLNGAGRGFEQYFKCEGSFERAVIEYYQREEVKAAAVIFKGEKRDIRDRQDANHVFVHIFDNDVSIEGDNAVYRATAYACKKSGIAIKDIDDIVTSCGKDITVPNIAATSQFACRSVVLDQGWYKRDSGVIVGLINETPVACVPKGSGSYTFFNGETEETGDLTQKLAEEISPKAFVLCRTLPSRALKKGDLFRFGAKSVRRSDLMLTMILALASTLIGILLPTLNQKIYDDYIPLGDGNQLIQICVVIASFMLGSLFFDVVKNLADFRISSHIGFDLQNAVYYRIFQLPESFFRNYDSADLAQRLTYVTVFAQKYTSAIIVSGISTILGLLYLYKMIKYSGKLTVFAALMIGVEALVIWFISTRIIKYQKEAEANKGEASSKLYQYLNGVEKIRMAGAEDKATNEYLAPYARLQNAELRRDRVSSLETMLTGSAATLFSMVFYYIIVKSNIKLSTGAFMAFNSAFGSFSGILMQTIANALEVYKLRPMLERFMPVIETAPEDDGKGKIPERFNGAVSVNNVCFSYDGVVNVLNGISIDIKPGEYVGIVGASGCGKSTLLKLLLGFETPGQGSIMFDDVDLKQMDKRAVRKNMGVVLQNGKLISGNILENITITAPHATMQEVNHVIEKVGLKDDIARMPMGLHTVLSENAGTISGGQQQRILIARAIIGSPSILIFDEATSALDNHTQAEVCKSLEEMKITRITVAHRLSTIRNCDKIFVMDKGSIVETGDYDSLMAKQGLFYQLATRQIS